MNWRKPWVFLYCIAMACLKWLYIKEIINADTANKWEDYTVHALNFQELWWCSMQTMWNAANNKILTCTIAVLNKHSLCLIEYLYLSTGLCCKFISCMISNHFNHFYSQIAELVNCLFKYRGMARRAAVTSWTLPRNCAIPANWVERIHLACACCPLSVCHQYNVSENFNYESWLSIV